MQRLRLSFELPVHGVGFAQVHELARAAEDAGLDGVWVPDHLVPLRAGGPPPLECWTLLAAVAAATHRVRVGPLVLVLPLRDPGLLALQARALAELSSGRLVLGIGLGGFTYRRAAQELGIKVHDVRERGRTLAEAITRLRAALERPPAQRAPLWLGGRSRTIIELAARSADGWNCPFITEFAARQRELDTACAAAGRDPLTLARSVYAIAAVAENEAQARRLAAAGDAMAKLFGDIAQHHVFGTPERAVAKLAELARAGASEVALHLAGDHASRLDTIAMLGSEVLPKLRD